LNVVERERDIRQYNSLPTTHTRKHAIKDKNKWNMHERGHEAAHLLIYCVKRRKN